mmetsp:Transcript_7615/g.11900  ORF Transcript_7615/g.11900 Transcript_7615/m.11900 type:complete len:198 (-) Transcript_7615:220-813(-)
MNNFLIGSSKFAVSSLRSNLAAPATRLVAARCFSSGDDDNEVKTGIIKYFSYKTQFGFIIPDGVDKKTHSDSDLFFIHRNDIKTEENANGEKFYPGLKRNLRVAFKVSPADDNGKSAKAYELTMADGTLVPPFQTGYLERYSKSQKAQFGDKVFTIMSTCADQQEMETKIVSAFDQVKENIEKQRAKMERAGVSADE